MNRLNIFVSATPRDLYAHQQAVRDVALSLNQQVILPAAVHFANADAVQRSYDGVQQADLFIGLYAHHYGYQPPADVHYLAQDGVRPCPGDKSLTHLEYAWARERSIPRLLFVLRDTDDDGEPLDWPGWRDPEPARMAAFRVTLRDDGVQALFRSPANLAKVVLDALEANLKLRGHEIEHQGWRVLAAPPPPPGFVGRERDVEAIRELLNTHRRVVIRGPGGVGKTALARYVGRELATHYSGGVLWAEFEPATMIPDLVLPRIWAEWQHISALARATATPDVTAKVMREWLLDASGPLLAIIDGAAHTAVLDAVLDSLPAHCHVLITAREIHLDSTHALKPYPLANLEPDTSVSFLLRRLPGAGEHQPQLTAVAAALGHHPLALELAGAWVAANGLKGLQSLEERLVQTEKPFAALPVGSEGDSNLERVLAVIYQSLPEDVRRDFRYLGTMPAGLDFGAETAFAVWGVDIQDPQAVADAERRLGWLVSTALLAPTGTGRFRIPSALYAYARALYAKVDGPIIESMSTTDDTQEIIRRIDADTEAPMSRAALLQQRLSAAMPPGTKPLPDPPATKSNGGDKPEDDKTHPTRPQQPPKQWPKADATAEVVQDQEKLNPDSPVARYHGEVMRLAKRFTGLDLNHWHPCIMLDICHIAHEIDGLVRQIESWPRVGLLESWAEPQAHIRRSALPRHNGSAVLRAALDLLYQAQASRFVVHWGMGKQGRRWLSLGLISARILRERKAEAEYLRMLAAWNDEQDRRRQAIAYYEAHLDISRELGDARAEADSLVDVGRVHRGLRDYPRALNYFHQALLINQRLRDLPAEANTLNKIGAIHYRLGENNKALDYFNQALYLSRTANDPDGEAATLHNMSFLVEPAEALTHMERACALWSALKSPNLKRAEQRLAELRWETEPETGGFDEIVLLAAFRVGGEDAVRVMLRESGTEDHQIEAIINYLREKSA